MESLEDGYQISRIKQASASFVDQCVTHWTRVDFDFDDFGTTGPTHGRRKATGAGAGKQLHLANQRKWQMEAHLGWYQDQVDLLGAQVGKAEAALRLLDHEESCLL